MVFLLSLIDSKFPQVFRTLLSILADLQNAVVCMVSTRPLITKSSSPCINPLVSVPNAPIIIGITVTFMFHCSFSSQVAQCWGCKIHRLHLCNVIRLHPNECPGYNIKQSDGEVLLRLMAFYRNLSDNKLWGMRSALSLSSLPGLDRVLFMDEIELNSVLILN